MSLDQKPYTERTKSVGGPRRWNRALAAAAAFAAVLVVVGIVATVGGGSGDTTVPPAITDAPTTTQTTTTNTTEVEAAPTTSALTRPVSLETQALLDQYAAVYNSGDVEAFAALHAPGIVRVAESGEDTWNSDLEQVSEFLEFFDAINQQLDLSDCEVSNATGIAWCRATRVDDLTRAAQIEDWTLLGLRFADDLVVEWREKFVGPNHYLAAIADFNAWMQETYPDEPTLTTGNDFLYSRGNGERAQPFLVEWGESVRGN